MNPPESPSPAPSASVVASVEPAQTATPGDVAAPAPAAPVYLSDGTQLILSLAAKVWLTALCGDGENDNWPGPSTPRQDLSVLFFAANGPEVWLAVGMERESGKFLPLVNRSTDLQLAMAQFANDRLDGLSLRQMTEMAESLWYHEHRTQVMPVQKKSPAELPMMTTSG